LILGLQGVFLINRLIFRVLRVERAFEYLFELLKTLRGVPNDEVVTRLEHQVGKGDHEVIRSALHTDDLHGSVGLFHSLGQRLSLHRACFQNGEVSCENPWGGVRERLLPLGKDMRRQEPQIGDSDASGDHRRDEEIEHFQSP
jgi:hypothetical protein